MSTRDDRQGEETKRALDAQALKRGTSTPDVRLDRFYVRIGLQRVPFTTPTDPRYAGLDDYAQCVICGAIVDVGGELTQHASEHL